MDPEKIGFSSGGLLKDEQMSSLATHFKDLPSYNTVFQNLKDIYNYFIEQDPFKVDMPEWIDELHPFEKMLIFKAIRGEKLELCIKQYVQARLGDKFIKPPPFDLDAA